MYERVPSGRTRIRWSWPVRWSFPNTSSTLPSSAWCGRVIRTCVGRSRRGGKCVVGSFDQISHQWLLDHIVMDRRTLHQWLKAGFIENQRLFPTTAGTPQGGIASPVLANLTLDGLEQ